jgi:CelD/BcsL family acetyltransferase involved in cellulose biosynthesis
MQEIEKRSHKKAKGIDLFSEEDASKLYYAFLENAPENCMIGYLSENGRKIAHVFGFAYKRTFLCTHMAFDEKYVNIGAGKIIIFKLLEELCDLEFCAFDFSKGDSQVKRELMSSFPSQYNLFFSRNAPVLFWWKLAIFLRSIVKNAKRAPVKFLSI